ncbi:hypothetical protein FDP41_011621 [Naegleria fowleri]|uniref:Uncharacterized protein n=1 Tax=Naegleria fowleri TaxID=5763 RepID=A0A6A5C6H8_NAEFO|nr:uncharacterized protein FDP41_011621 [Naegleria fowleri]KAF0982691.1 hypothetical protein FDP41_011621 [Naegleria fowleri]
MRLSRHRKYDGRRLSLISFQPRFYYYDQNEHVNLDIEEFTTYQTPFIENCALVYECPVVQYLFPDFRNADIVHCEKCNKSVQFIETMGEFKSLICKEQCIAYRREKGGYGGGMC